MTDNQRRLGKACGRGQRRLKERIEQTYRVLQECKQALGYTPSQAADVRREDVLPYLADQIFNGQPSASFKPDHLEFLTLLIAHWHALEDPDADTVLFIPMAPRKDVWLKKQ